MAKDTLPLIENDESVRVWVNEKLGKVVTDFLGDGTNLGDDDDEDYYIDESGEWVADRKIEYGAYSLCASYDIACFDLSRLDCVSDGDIVYGGKTVYCTDSAQVLMRDEGSYDRPRHKGIVMGMLNLPTAGWKQVAGHGFGK
jgi:hypothetical protein